MSESPEPRPCGCKIAGGPTEDGCDHAPTIDSSACEVGRLRAENERLTDIERLAEAEHEQWMRWAKTLLEKEPGISEERRRRWSTLFVPYAELSEESKEQDRKEARQALSFKSSTSAGTGDGSSVGTEYDKTVKVSESEHRSSPAAEAEDPPRCGICTGQTATHWFKMITVRGWRIRAQRKPMQSFRPPDDHKRHPEEWRKCPGPARKEGK